MLERFKRLLEIVKDNEELEKALEYGLDKVENTINIRAYKTECFLDEEIRKVAEKINGYKLLSRLNISSARLINDELSFMFRLIDSDLVCRYNAKDYSFIGFELFFYEDFIRRNKIDEKELEEAKERMNKKLTLLNKNENKILCHSVVRLVQKELAKDSIFKLLQEIDSVIKDIENIPYDSVCDIESNCDSIVENLKDFKKEFSDLLKIKLI